MATRMERYYKKESNGSRSKKNKNLYNTIYSYGSYSNIEGVADAPKSNEVDITQVKKMLDNREKYQKQRRYRNLTRTDIDYERPKPRPKYVEDTERDYDIRDVLNKAREEKKPDDKERVLRNTNYDILKDLNLDGERKRMLDEEDSEELQDMLQTITDTSLASKNDDDLASDLFSDLKGDDTKVGEIKNINELIDDNEKTRVMDNTFFTSSIKLSKSDFEGGKRKVSVFKVIVVLILVIAIIFASAILIMKRISFKSGNNWQQDKGEYCKIYKWAFEEL